MDAQLDLWMKRRQAVTASFTPAAPVRDSELFAGRREMLVRLMDTCQAAGEHAAVFGERGVGKTSLATVTARFCEIRGLLTLRVNCQVNDDATDVWERVGETLNRLLVVAKAKEEDLGKLEDTAPAAIELLTSTPDHADILTALQILSDTRPTVVILDEFDRATDVNLKTILVDLMKTIADQGMKVTIIIVGVADDVDALLDEHESAGRGLNQVLMPRMSLDELMEIVDRGLAPAKMEASPDSKRLIAALSMGLPHYTHLLGLQSALKAIGDRTTQVGTQHVVASLPDAAQRAQQHVTELYHAATHSTQSNMFREVLLAAALTPTDERGFFAPGDVRDALEEIMGRRYEIPAFSKHLKSFSDERGPVLQRSGKQNRPRYRFVEPLLIPYACMTGLRDELIDRETMVRHLEARMVSVHI